MRLIGELGAIESSIRHQRAGKAEEAAGPFWLSRESCHEARRRISIDRGSRFLATPTQKCQNDTKEKLNSVLNFSPNFPNCTWTANVSRVKPVCL